MAERTEEFIYERLARRLEQQIGQGVFRAGDRLPSIRKLCALERVSVASAMQALSLLEAKGAIEIRPQSGSFVRPQRLEASARPAPTVCRLEPQTVGVSDLAAEIFRQTSDERKVPLGVGVPSPELLPADRLARLAAAELRSARRGFARYGESAGHPEYLHQLAVRFAAIGCTVPEQEIVATAGAMEALNLAVRAVARAGDVVAVESPCYFGFLQILESLGVKALSIPASCDTGIDLDLLREAIVRHRVKAVMLVATFNNPNGSCLPEEKRRQLLRLLDEHDVPLIEDDVYGDMHFGDERPRPVKAFDEHGRVIFCGSFSKSLSPGLRVGWIAAGRYAERVKRLKLITTLATPTLNQAVIARYLESGALERHLRSLRRALRAQVAQVGEAVLAAFPDGTAISHPEGGFFLWVQLPERVDATAVYRCAVEAGVHVVPGQVFCPEGSIASRIRLSCAYPFDDRIAAGIEKLGAIVHDLRRQRLGASAASG